MIDEARVRERVKVLVQTNGGVRALARRLRISASYVSDVCSGRRAPGPPFLKALGLRKVVGYENGEGKQ